MRDSNDKRTLTIEGIPAMRGRPETGKAKSVAQRQKDYRARKELEKVRRNNELVNKFEGKSNHIIAGELQHQLWLAIPDDAIAQEAKATAKDVWEEIGRRMKWL